MLRKFTNFLIDLLFPRFCFNCQQEGSYLCQDCQATLEILQTHKRRQTSNLKDLYFALPYQSPLIKNLIQRFKYKPFIKELAKPLASLIIEHFRLLDNKPPFLAEGKNFVLIPIPLEKEKLKHRGFNQAGEISKELSTFLTIPLISNCLVKTRETIPQAELTKEERRENIKGVFLVKNRKLVKDKKILLLDDIYTTGSTMEEAARVLKEAGAKEIIGIVVARAKPGDDRF